MTETKQKIDRKREDRKREDRKIGQTYELTPDTAVKHTYNIPLETLLILF